VAAKPAAQMGATVPWRRLPAVCRGPKRITDDTRLCGESVCCLLSVVCWHPTTWNATQCTCLEGLGGISGAAAAAAAAIRLPSSDIYLGRCRGSPWYRMYPCLPTLAVWTGEIAWLHWRVAAVCRVLILVVAC